MPRKRKKIRQEKQKKRGGEKRKVEVKTAVSNPIFAFYACPNFAS